MKDIRDYKIIQIAHGYPGQPGGVQKVTQELSERLADKGLSVDVVYPTQKEEVVEHDRLGFYPLSGIEIAHTPVVPGLVKYMANVPINSILHIHIAKGFMPEIAAVIANARRIPYIAHFHLDINASGMFGFLLPMYKKLFLSKVLRNAVKVVVLNQVHKEFVCSQYGVCESTVVIPNGVGSEFFIERQREAKDVTNLLYVGRLSEQKQVHILIDAMTKVKSRVELNIVGTGEKEEDLKAQVDFLGLGNVTFHGRKTGEDLKRFYKQGDLFLLSSKQEGLPLTLIEAMAAGIPIVASDVRGTREFIGEDGLLVHPNSPDEFAKQIDMLISDEKLYQHLLESGIRKAKKHNWDKITEQFISLYEEVIHENK